MFRHDDVSHDDEAIAFTGVFQDREESVAVANCAQKRRSPVTRAGDKVQVTRAVSAIQAARHDTHNSPGSIVSRPCKERKDGAPDVPDWEKAGPAARVRTK